jgi:hypothetical protein
MQSDYGLLHEAFHKLNDEAKAKLAEKDKQMEDMCANCKRGE